MGQTVSKPIQFALDCILLKNKNFEVTNFEITNFKIGNFEQKLLCNNNSCKKVNKFIKTCKNTALNNAGCQTLQKTGKLLNATDNLFNSM